MNKKNLILAVILVFLLGAAYAYRYPYQDWRAKRGQVDNFLSRVDYGVVDKMEIKSGGKTTVLTKKDDRWLIDGTKEFFVSVSRTSAMKDIFQKAQKAKISVISENAEKKKEFQTNESGINLKMSAGDKILLDFVIGSRTSDFSGSFVSELGSEKTYAVEADLNSAFGSSDWYDKTVFATDKEKIKSIRFQYPDSKAFVVEKNDKGEWSGVQPYKFPVKKEKMDAILSAMSGLQAAAVPAQTFAGTGLEKHNIIVQATGDGIDNTIMIGDKNKEGLYFAKKGESDNIYLISAEERNALSKRISDFK